MGTEVRVGIIASASIPRKPVSTMYLLRVGVGKRGRGGSVTLTPDYITTTRYLVRGACPSTAPQEDIFDSTSAPAFNFFKRDILVYFEIEGG